MKYLKNRFLFVAFFFVTVIFVIIGVYFFLIMKGPLFLVGTLFPECIVEADPRLVETLLVSRGQSLNEITQILLAEKSINPCLLANFLKEDALLIDLLSSTLIEHGFLVTKNN